MYQRNRMVISAIAVVTGLFLVNPAQAQQPPRMPRLRVAPIQPPSKTGWVPKRLWKPFKAAVATRAAASMGLLDRQGRPDASKVKVYTSGWSRGLSKKLWAHDSGQYRGGHIIQAKRGHLKGAYFAYQSRQGHVEVFPIALTGTQDSATKGKHVAKVDAKQPYHGTYAYAEHSMPAQKTVQLVKAKNTAYAVSQRGQDGASILASKYNASSHTTTYLVHGKPTDSNEARDPKATAAVSLYKNRYVLQRQNRNAAPAPTAGTAAAAVNSILPGGCVISPNGDSTVRTKFLDQERGPVICPMPPIRPPMPPVIPFNGNAQ